MKTYICSVCGYKHIGDTAPQRCPACKAPINRFAELKRKIGPNDDVILLGNGEIKIEPKDSRVLYYYIDKNGVQAGPVYPREFGKLGINKHTMVWRDGMTRWLPAGQLSELSFYFEIDSKQNGQIPPVGNHQQPLVNTQQKPDNFMVWAILSTLVCCLATGIAAIVEANKVDNYWYAGKYQESIKAMNDARKWTFISLAIGIIGYLLLMLFGPSGLLFFQLLLLTLYVVYILITGIGTGASPIFASLLWIGGIIFLCWFIPKLFNFCF